MGCIKIDNNVFIGANTTILANVHIGSNIIVGAGSLVNKDLESGYVYAGVPAKKICSFEEFTTKRIEYSGYPKGMVRNGDSVGDDLASCLWKKFYESRA